MDKKGVFKEILLIKSDQAYLTFTMKPKLLKYFEPGLFLTPYTPMSSSLSPIAWIAPPLAWLPGLKQSISPPSLSRNVILYA